MGEQVNTRRNRAHWGSWDTVLYVDSILLPTTAVCQGNPAGCLSWVFLNFSRVLCTVGCYYLCRCQLVATMIECLLGIKSRRQGGSGGCWLWYLHCLIHACRLASVIKHLYIWFGTPWRNYLHFVCSSSRGFENIKHTVVPFNMFKGKLSPIYKYIIYGLNFRPFVQFEISILFSECYF